MVYSQKQAHGILIVSANFSMVYVVFTILCFSSAFMFLIISPVFMSFDSRLRHAIIKLHFVIKSNNHLWSKEYDSDL